jgi:membrane fusion protein
MTESLFREEVIQARRNSWLGSISLVQPLRLHVLGAFATAAALGAILFLAFGEYTHRSRVTGQLVPDLGLATVVAPASGVVGRRFPSEGDRVAAGDALVLIGSPHAMASGADLQDSLRGGIDRRRQSVEANLASLEARNDEQSAGFARQLAAARGELAQVEREVSTRRNQVRLADETTARYRQLAASRYLSQVQVRQQEQLALEQLSQQQALERQAIGLERTIAQLELALRELPSQLAAQRAAAQGDLALLDQERAQSDIGGERLVKSPVSGLVASQAIEPGQAVQAGQPLLTILPANSSLQAQLLVPSRAIGFVAPGDEVLLRYQAFPYQKFGHHRGTVVRISRSALGREELAAYNVQATERHYRVLVAIERQSIRAYGKQEPLRPGMLLDADIMGDRRKLYEWVLEPLYSLSGRL